MYQNLYFDRAFFKARAKESLRTSYLKALLVSLVLNVLGATSGYAGTAVHSVVTATYPSSQSDFSGISGVLVPIIAGLFALTGFAMFVYTFFVAYPLEVGGSRYFLEATQHRFNLGSILYGFNGGNYWNVVKAQFRREVYQMLWSMLFFIPGIIKYYGYSMTPYLLAENPSLDGKRAITISRHMTRGYRFQMFIFDLSFIGWYLLGGLFFGVGIVFVFPYYHASKAELYLFLRTNAIDRGITTAQELSPPDLFF